MLKKIVALTVLVLAFLTMYIQHSCAMTLAEAMMRLQVEALKAQMDEFLALKNVDKARFILEEMVKLDEKIQLLSEDGVSVYANISEKRETDTDGNGKPQNAVTTSDDVLGKYEKTIIEVCAEMEFDPAVIWTILAIESNFSEDPVVVQRKSKCLGPWQHQPEHYIHYRKADGTPYNPFDIRDACEVTVSILEDNLAVTGDLEKSIRMYASGSKYLDTLYEQLPRSTRDYLDKFERIYPEAKARFEKYGIYDEHRR